ncbi:CynX/NimT family MFS transporter [Thorsellia anophelis]|uniref:MFS transporter, CP family, cyanate transporter n=1 Tax=Thorsellia anophelis DSM 18579 TaxID=1123402 RepID=A0A1I0EAT6_9GAMM|nr:MFS transporter [Thorsellia anophelis]SET41493.1 MFS transporter, CP family, cyanate transporter [Thorsellia anophelis DSM 18579]
MANITPSFKLSIKQGRVLILISILVTSFNLRTAVTSLTPLVEKLHESFEFGNFLVGVFGMLPTMAFAAAGIVTPAFMRKINLEKTVIAAMLFAFIGLLLRSYSMNIPFFLASSLIALLGMGMGNVVLPPLVKRYFPEKIGSISIYYIVILQIGTLLPAFTAVPLANLVDWRFSLGIWAVTAFISLALWLYVWFAYPAMREASVASSSSNNKAATPEIHNNEEDQLENHKTQGKVWRAPLAWGLALMFGMTSLNTYSMFSWLPRIFTSAGATQVFAGNMVGLFSALGLLSAFLAPLAAVRLKNPLPFVLICIFCFVTGYLGLLFAPLAAPLIWVTLVGLGPSTFPFALTLINLRTRTAQGSASLSSFGQGIGYLLSCAGPLMFGLFHDWFNNWHAPFIFLGFCLCVLFIGGLIVSKPRFLEDEW